MLLVNGEVVPSIVFELAVVGAVEVLQQTPCAVIAAPPVAVTVPPELAVVAAIEVTAVVVTVGAEKYPYFAFVALKNCSISAWLNAMLLIKTCAIFPLSGLE